MNDPPAPSLSPNQAPDGSSGPDHDARRPGSIRERWQRWLVMLVVTTACCAVDQATKHWAHHGLRRQHAGRLDLVDGYLSLTYVRNPGAAWGFLSQHPASFRRPFFLSVSVVAILFILYLYVRLAPGQRLLMFALSLVMGGAIGNFIDRLRFDYVIDFIDFHVGRSFKWPTFNVADAAITSGVLILFIEMMVATVRQRRRRRASSLHLDSTPPDDPGGRGPDS